MNVQLVLAQKQANIWYFGTYAGLDFNSGEPVALLDGAMEQHEGCASIADDDGNLLFYTNGIEIWNKNHVTMANGTGLKGHESSTQSAIIVPKPGSSTIYYVFTVDAVSGMNGLQYSEVDLSLQGGLGEVVQKNIPLVAPVLEKVTAVKQQNGEDYWVITHEAQSDAFYVYSVTVDGVNETPEVSNIFGARIEGLFNDAGYMKVAPNGKKIAMANSVEDVHLYDFDPSTGVVSGFEVIKTTESFNHNFYGLEFSPGGKFLYVTSPFRVENNITYKEIHQFDMNSPDIGASEQLIYSDGDSNVAFPYAMQLGPDGRIYVSSHSGKMSLGVINYPDSAGTSCFYEKEGVSLGGRVARIGLPQFIQSYFYPTPEPRDTVYPEIEFPNVLTVNNDGLNDVYDINTVNLSEIDFKVFNRWGKLVFETTDLDVQWDGTNNNGDQLLEGTYFVEAQYSYLNDQVGQQKLSVTLFR